VVDLYSGGIWGHEKVMQNTMTAAISAVHHDGARRFYTAFYHWQRGLAKNCTFTRKQGVVHG